MLYKALTWILLLIVAYLAAAVAGSVVAAIVDALDGHPGRLAPSVSMQMVYAFCYQLAFTLAPCYVPTALRHVAPTMFAIGVLLRVGPPVYMFMSYPYIRERASQDIGAYVYPMIAGILGGVTAVMIDRWRRARRSPSR